MVKIGTVWDSTVEALKGRADIIAPLAALTLFLPGVVQAAMASYWPVAPGAVGRSLFNMVLQLGLLLLTLYGALAITAVASHPDTTRAAAGRQAASRLWALVGVVLVIGFALLLLSVPLGLTLASEGVNMALIGQPGYAPRISAGGRLFVSLYTIAALLLAVWIFSRLAPLTAVVLHERRAIGAIPRAFRLTAGMGLRLVGVALLFLVVLFVSASAAQLVVGTVMRLLLGAENIPTVNFLSAIAAAAVSAFFSALAYVFAARLYVALAGRETVPTAAAPTMGDGTTAY